MIEAATIRQIPYARSGTRFPDTKKPSNQLYQLIAGQRYGEFSRAYIPLYPKHYPTAGIFFQNTARSEIRGKSTAIFSGYISHFIPNIIPPLVFSFKTGSQSIHVLAEEACCGAAFAGRASLSPRKGPPPASWGKRNTAPISAHGLRHHSSLHPLTIICR